MPSSLSLSSMAVSPSGPPSRSSGGQQLTSCCMVQGLPSLMVQRLEGLPSHVEASKAISFHNLTSMEQLPSVHRPKFLVNSEVHTDMTQEYENFGFDYCSGEKLPPQEVSARANQQEALDKPYLLETSIPKHVPEWHNPEMHTPISNANTHWQNDLIHKDCSVIQTFPHPSQKQLCTEPRNVCSPPYTHLPPIDTTSQPSKKKGKWVRPLGYAERFMSSAHEFGCMTTIYALWMDSRKPIQFSVIRKAISIMYRKMPHLRMILGRHRGDCWWKEMESEKVDVEELSTVDVMASIEELLKYRFRMEEGPLWFTRFVTLQNDPSERKSMDHRDVNHDLRYKYACLFGFHHNITDGTTNMHFCNVFLGVLNGMLQGIDINLKEEGFFAEPLHDQLADAGTDKWRRFRIFLRKFYKGVLSYGAYVWNFTKHYRMPFRQPAATNVVYHELDEETTKKLIRRCKDERVTLNSAFTAAGNLALYQMIKSKDPNIDSTIVNSLQAINMRRYWPKEKQKDTFGCHISVLDLCIKTKHEHLSHFWDYSRLVHASLMQRLVKTREPLVVQPLSERVRIVVFSNSILNRLRLPSMNSSHFCVTNMGNLSTTFPGTGPEVEVSKLMRSVSCHFMPSLCQQTIQTFRGRFSYSLDYYTNKMSKDTAETYSENILNILKSCIDSPM